MTPIITVALDNSDFYIKEVLNPESMKTIDDLQLENELQELYLVTKYWISGLEFYKTELNFFQKLSLRYIGDDKERIRKLKAIIQKTASLKEKVIAVEVQLYSYLKCIEPLITNPPKILTVLFLKEHLEIAKEVDNLFNYFKAIKQEILDFTDQSIATRCFESDRDITKSS